jgi:hypothetical protein
MKIAIKYPGMAIISIVLTLISCTGNKKDRGNLKTGTDTIEVVAENPVPLAPVDTRRVMQIAALLPEKPSGFGKNYHSREVWDSLSKIPEYQNIIQESEKLLSIPFPAWDDEAYLLYFTKGTRPEGQKMMGDRHGWLGPLVIAECLENRNRFIPAIEMVFREIIGQRSWTHPAHDSRKQNFEGRNFTVDLGAANLGHSMAQAIFLLDDKLSPEIRKDILNVLYKRIFNPVLGTIAGKNKDQWWLTTTSNWNAVCLAGVTGAALSAIPGKAERAEFVAIAEKYSKNSVIGFTDDGYCTEGLGYFAYGFGHYVILREKILQATGNALDLFSDEKIKKIAAYAPNMEILNSIYPSIADCRTGTKAPSDILWYCSRNLGMGLEQYDTMSIKGAPSNLITGLMYAFPNSASLSKISEVRSEYAPGIRSDFNYAGVLIVRPVKGTKCNIAAALKGGNNNEHHNHNDVGSYSVVVGDEMLMGDPGGPFVYRSNTFGSERYTAYKNLASYGHPVPLVAGEQQFPGKEAKAKIIRKSFSEKKDLFVMDIASAYKVEGLKLVRFFTFDRRKQGKLIVRDEFSFAKPESFETALTTRAKCSETGKGKIEFSGERNKMVATIKAPGEYEIGYETIQGDFTEYTRVVIRLKDPVKKGVIEIEFMPVN